MRLPFSSNCRVSYLVSFRVKGLGLVHFGDQTCVARPCEIPVEDSGLGCRIGGVGFRGMNLLAQIFQMHRPNDIRCTSYNLRANRKYVVAPCGGLG